jgi:hypothetical protein
VLGVVYRHLTTAEGGDLYLTSFGMRHADLLQVENWYEPTWFRQHRQRLQGTSTVYRLPTRPVDGRSLDLVVKNCRVGEDVPVDTKLLQAFLDAEFNSPWEEFSLVMELREGEFGPRDRRIATQEPLAIYVPPERMQEWQTGRSEDRINRIQRRHPGMALDILRQYKLIYRWIPGRDLVETLSDLGAPTELVEELPWKLNERALAAMEEKGFTVADMKPVHVILAADDLARIAERGADAAPVVERLVEERRYAIIDYELLLRTPEYEAQVNRRRRSSYLDDLRCRFQATDLPPHLDQVEILGVPYVHGHVESTGGRLWVVGRNGRLFDYFLPERWRRTPGVQLSAHNDVQYTLTKDRVHLVWKTSMVGETPSLDGDPARTGRARIQGYNSPFEEAAVAAGLAAAGIPTTAIRAIYMTGSRKLEPSEDPSRYASHAGISGPDGTPVLLDTHNYVVIQGYCNGTDGMAAADSRPLLRPLSLAAAVQEGCLAETGAAQLVAALVARMQAAGFDGGLLGMRDVIVQQDGDRSLVRGPDGAIELRVCDFKLIRRLGG